MVFHLLSIWTIKSIVSMITISKHFYYSKTILFLKLTNFFLNLFLIWSILIWIFKKWNFLPETIFSKLPLFFFNYLFYGIFLFCIVSKNYNPIVNFWIQGFWEFFNVELKNYRDWNNFHFLEMLQKCIISLFKFLKLSDTFSILIDTLLVYQDFVYAFWKDLVFIY